MTRRLTGRYGAFGLLLWLSLSSALAHGQLKTLIQLRIDTLHSGHAVRAGGDLLLARESLVRFYRARNYQPVWQGREKLVDQLLLEVKSADSAGLHPEDYHLLAIQRLRTPAEKGAAEEVRRAELDLLLSDAFLVYGAHLAAGKVSPSRIDPLWIAQRPGLDLVPVLQRALDNSAVASALEQLKPQDRGYRMLVHLRAKWRHLALQPWQPIASGPALHLGDQDSRAAQLRMRLSELETLGSETDPATPSVVYDSGMVALVERFQRQQGLRADGVVGRDTLAALNIAPQVRLAQIDANLERWRWLPVDLGGRYLMVNIAGFHLQLVENGQVIMSKPVVVGKTYRRTPVFSGQVRYVVLNPSWTVPHKLAVEDKLPEIQADPDYLQRMGFKVYLRRGADQTPVGPKTVNWQQLDRANFPYRLVQAPGPQNALGEVKFLFPNPYDVYLHDTPSRDLFSQDRRSFSSGCIRLQDPLELARYLLASDGYSADDLGRLLATGKTRVLRLGHPIPIYLEYWTVWVDAQDSVHWRPDIYVRDGRVEAALNTGPDTAPGESRATVR